MNADDRYNYLNDHYQGNVFDFTAFYFGYNPSSVDWNTGAPDPNLFNRFKSTVKESIHSPLSTLVPEDPTKDYYVVKRDTFFEWAQEKWAHYDTETEAARLSWKKYKADKAKKHQLNKKSSPTSKKRMFEDWLEQRLKFYISDETDGMLFKQSESKSKKQIRQEFYNKFKGQNYDTLRKYFHEIWVKQYPIFKKEYNSI